MAWIESQTALIRNLQVIELARDLRLRRSYVIGHLHALWHAVLEQAEDGDLSQWSDKIIASMSDYPGDASQYVQLLQRHGILAGKIVCNWPQYAGPYLMRKYAKVCRDRLLTIWEKHGMTYGGQPTRGRAGCDDVLPHKQKPSKNQVSPQPLLLYPNDILNDNVKVDVDVNTNVNDKVNTNVNDNVNRRAGQAGASVQGAFVDRFGAVYNARTGMVYKADQKDYVLAAGMIRRFGADAVMQRAEILAKLCETRAAFFTQDCGWGGFTVGNLSAHWNRLVVVETEMEMARRKVRDDRERIDAILNR